MKKKPSTKESKKNISQEKEKAPTHQVVRAPLHKKYYVTNVRGGLTAQDFRFELMNEKIENGQNQIFFVCDATIILSPIGAKRLFIKLSKSVKEFEEKYGNIPENPKEDRFVNLIE